jgi:hypothetical protein
LKKFNNLSLKKTRSFLTIFYLWKGFPLNSPRKSSPSISSNILDTGIFYYSREMRLIASKNVAFVEYGDEYQSTVAMNGNFLNFSFKWKTYIEFRLRNENFLCKKMIFKFKNIYIIIKPLSLFINNHCW